MSRVRRGFPTSARLSCLSTGAPPSTPPDADAAAGARYGSNVVARRPRRLRARRCGRLGRAAVHINEPLEQTSTSNRRPSRRRCGRYGRRCRQRRSRLNDPLRTGILRFSPKTLAVAFPTHGIENEPDRGHVLRRTGEHVEVAALPLHHGLRRATVGPARGDEGCVEDRGERLDLPVRRLDRCPHTRIARLPQRMLRLASARRKSG